MKRDGQEIAVAALSIVGVISLVPLSMIWSGYVLSVMWAWFLAPLGVPALGVAQAIGVSMTVQMLNRYSRADEAAQSPSMWTGITHAAFTPAVALLMGWIVQRYV